CAARPRAKLSNPFGVKRQHSPTSKVISSSPSGIRRRPDKETTARPLSPVEDRQHDFQQDQEDDDDLEKFHPKTTGLVGQHLVDALGHLQLALDAALPLAQ